MHKAVKTQTRAQTCYIQEPKGLGAVPWSEDAGGPKDMVELSHPGGCPHVWYHRRSSREEVYQVSQDGPGQVRAPSSVHLAAESAYEHQPFFPLRPSQKSDGQNPSKHFH